MNSEGNSLENLLVELDKVLCQIQNSKRILFLTDYDGTLTPIVERPEMAVLSQDMRLLLLRLAAKPHVTVGIISGRALQDLKNQVNISGLVYAGNHGLEIEGPGFAFVNPIANEIKPVFRVVCQILSMTLSSVKGVFVEDKGLTLSVHYRQADESNTQAVQQIVESSLKGPLFSGILKLTRGKKVVEVRPAVPWDKGKAIRLLMKRYGKGGKQSGLVPIYLGDDSTDEDGFKIIEKYSRGISVHVGEEPIESAARYFLKSTHEVLVFLSKLLESKPRNVVCEQFSTI